MLSADAWKRRGIRRIVERKKYGLKKARASFQFWKWQAESSARPFP